MIALGHNYYQWYLADINNSRSHGKLNFSLQNMANKIAKISIDYNTWSTCGCAWLAFQ